MKNYNQLTLEQRYQISALLKLGFNKSAIAKELAVHKSTIGRELKRNLSRRGYRAKFADRQTLVRRKNKVKPRIAEKTWTAIEAKINQQWSPAQISGRFALEDTAKVSHEWIYQRIYRDKQMGGTLYLNLRCQRLRKKRYGKYDKRGTLKNQISIDQRPEVVERKSRLGDWELDTIIGKGSSAGNCFNDRAQKQTAADKKGRAKNGQIGQPSHLSETQGFDSLYPDL